MKKNRNILAWTAAIFGAGILMLSGCAQRAVPRTGQPGNQLQGKNLQGEMTQKPKTSDNIPHIVNEKQGTNLQTPTTQQQDFSKYKQKADHISGQLTKLNEVEKADALVVGNTCLVGYKPSKASKKPDATKNMIIDKVKSLDPSIENVVASESGDVINRIKKLSADIAGNRPVEQINTEFMQLVKSVKPEAR